MWTRFLIWKERRRAKITSEYNYDSSYMVVAKLGQVTVGKFRRGKEIK